MYICLYIYIYIQICRYVYEYILKHMFIHIYLYRLGGTSDFEGLLYYFTFFRETSSDSKRFRPALKLHSFQVCSLVSCMHLHLRMFLQSVCSSTWFRFTLAGQHVSGQSVELHLLEIGPRNSTCFRSTSATPHVSGWLLVFHIVYSGQPWHRMFLDSHRYSKWFKSAQATAHVSGQPLQLHLLPVSPCKSISFWLASASPFVWALPCGLCTLQFESCILICWGPDF